MPRIRSIKPEFWNDEKLGKESESVMLTFIGLWNFSDDYGVVRANPTWLKNQIYPYKDKLRIDAFTAWLDRLAALEMIVPFTFRGESFYYIRMFRKHQKVERPSKARCVQEPDLQKILTGKGYFFNQAGELLKDSVSNRGVFGEGSPTEEDKEEDKDKEEEVCTPPVGEAANHTDEEKVQFLKFQNWIKEKAPAVAKMEQPFTIDQYLKIRQQLTKDVVTDLLLRMNNWKPLLKKNKSAYQTILNWSKLNWNKDAQNVDDLDGTSAATKELLKKIEDGGKH